MKPHIADSDEATATLAVLHILTDDAQSARTLILRSLEIARHVASALRD